MYLKTEASKITLSAFPGPSGSGVLHVLECAKVLPFTVDRVFTVTGMAAGSRRGGHANMIVNECVVCLHGAVQLTLTDGSGAVTHHLLSTPQDSVLIPAGTWADLEALADNTAYMVLADCSYETASLHYERDISHFLARGRL